MTAQKNTAIKQNTRGEKGRRVDDGAKNRRNVWRGRAGQERRDETMTAGVKGGDDEGEDRWKGPTGEREREEIDIKKRGRKERKRRVSDSLSSSARNCCPEIRRTIRSCQDQHTDTHRACTGRYIHCTNKVQHLLVQADKPSQSVSNCTRLQVSFNFSSSEQLH